MPVKANAWRADLFVSIHCNAANTVARGTETLVYRFGTQGAALAEAVQSKIVSALGTVDRGDRVYVFFALPICQPYLSSWLLSTNFTIIHCSYINKNNSLKQSLTNQVTLSLPQATVIIAATVQVATKLLNPALREIMAQKMFGATLLQVAALVALLMVTLPELPLKLSLTPAALLASILLLTVWSIT